MEKNQFNQSEGTDSLTVYQTNNGSMSKGFITAIVQEAPRSWKRKNAHQNL